MCGSATLAIVVSTPCMIVASMIEAVIAVRLTGRRNRLVRRKSLMGGGPRNDPRLRIPQTVGATRPPCNSRPRERDMSAGLVERRKPG